MKRIASVAVVCLMLLTMKSEASSLWPFTDESPRPPSVGKLLTVTPSHQLFYQGPSQDYYLMINLAGPPQKESVRLPLNLSIVIDRSGSMGDRNKMTYVKSAAKTFIRSLGREDRVSIVDYDDKITILAEPTLVGDHREALIAKIDTLFPRDATNLAGGMMQGAALVERFLSNQTINRVLLLSDGLANVGVSKRPEVQNLAQKLGGKGIQVTTFGVGTDFDEDMMSGIADASAGNYYFIESPTQVAGIFEKERNALTTVCAKNTRLEVNLRNAVDLVEVYGYSYQTDQGKIVVSLPDLYSGQNQKIILKLKTHLSESTRDLSIARIAYLYDDVANDMRRSNDEVDVRSEITNDTKAYERSVSTATLAEVLKTQAGREMDQAMRDYSSGNVDDAKKRMSQVQSHFSKAYELAPSPKLKADMDEALNATSSMGTTTPGSEEGKVLIKSQKAGARDAMMH